MSKPKILAFSRIGSIEFFPFLKSNIYDIDYAVINKKEKKRLIDNGGNVIACLEEEYNNLEPSSIDSRTLNSSYSADRFNKYLNIQDRYEYISKITTFWDNIFNHIPYTFCLRETVAIEIDEVMAKKANEYGVMDLNYLVSIFPNTFYWKSNPFNSTIGSERFNKTLVNQKNIYEAKVYFNELQQNGHKPFYIKNTSKTQKKEIGLPRLIAQLVKRELKNALGFIKSPKYNFIKNDVIFNYTLNLRDPYDTTDYNFYNNWTNLLFKKKGKYDTLPNDNNFKLLLFPLHFEPEATLSYFGSQAIFQENIIQDICKNLPPEYILLVKEHPQQQDTLLTMRFQELNKHNSNLLFLPSHLDSRKLLEKIDAVVTLVSSVGWESVNLGIPTICLSNVFYDKHPNVIKLDKTNKLKNLNQFLADYKPCDDEDSINYIAKMRAISNEGNPNFSIDPFNIECFKKAIENEVLNYLESKTEYWLRKDLNEFFNRREKALIN